MTVFVQRNLGRAIVLLVLLAAMAALAEMSGIARPLLAQALQAGQAAPPGGWR